MTTVQAEKIARRKLSLLQLAQELGNVSKAVPVEKAILAHTLDHPTHGAQPVADELMLKEVPARSGAVRRVWILG